MNLRIIGNVDVRLQQGSLDDPNGAIIISGKDSTGDICEYRFNAVISPLGDLTGKQLKKGETINTVEMKFESKY